MRPFPRGAVICYAGRSLYDIAIRTFSGSHITHCAVAMGDGSAIQAQWGGPVRYCGEREASNIIYGFAYPGDVEKFISTLKTHIGRPYDYLGLLNVPLWNMTRACVDPNLARTVARFCSTLIADAVRYDEGFKEKIAPWKPLHAVDPQDIYNHFSGNVCLN